MRTRGITTLLVLLALGLAVTPAFAQRPRKHIDVTCLPNEPPGQPSLTAVFEFDLPRDNDAFLAYGALCRQVGGHIVDVRDYH